MTNAQQPEAWDTEIDWHIAVAADSSILELLATKYPLWPAVWHEYAAELWEDTLKDRAKDAQNDAWSEMGLFAKKADEAAGYCT